MNACWRIVVSGKVQGVFYRASTVEQATKLGVTGFAQNLPDGRVLIEAEGDEASLAKLVAWCKQGPPRAVVTHVHVTQVEGKGYSDFSIKR